MTKKMLLVLAVAVAVSVASMGFTVKVWMHLDHANYYCEQENVSMGDVLGRLLAGWQYGKCPQITICHATHSDTNPYVEITVDTSSVNLQGHRGHDGDIIPAPAGGCPGPEPTVVPPTDVPPTDVPPTVDPCITDPESCQTVVPPTEQPRVTPTATEGPQCMQYVDCAGRQGKLDVICGAGPVVVKDGRTLYSWEYFKANFEQITSACSDLNPTPAAPKAGGNPTDPTAANRLFNIVVVGLLGLLGVSFGVYRIVAAKATTR